MGLFKAKARNGDSVAVMLLDVKLHAPAGYVPQLVRMGFDYETSVRMTGFHMTQLPLPPLSHSGLEKEGNSRGPEIKCPESTNEKRRTVGDFVAAETSDFQITHYQQI